ncbi:MAG: hypothetical protein CSA60_04465 [Neptuniibacter caesariensis]|uniref:Ankyrin repeat domain-containing protein n=1 Tax=Neptuniibacter caesariensis TaxID=207954 RepID=A0A2G6JIY2_NEPCE|nr:MAG: hypothetical protein CSA60_04465 [Neptuniibacter caesariensis]
MLKLFKSDPLAQACKTIDSGDMQKLAQCLRKISTDELNQPVSDTQPPLAEYCIRQQSPSALKLVLNHGANPNLQVQKDKHNSLTQLALAQDNSLPLLTALYNAGSEADPTQLALQCFDYCEPNTLMLHLSFLLQQGARLNSKIVHQAFIRADLQLIHFIINSGANKPEDFYEQDYSEQVVSYAEKCWQDLEIRKMFL